MPFLCQEKRLESQVERDIFNASCTSGQLGLDRHKCRNYQQYIQLRLAYLMIGCGQHQTLHNGCDQMFKIELHAGTFPLTLCTLNPTLGCNLSSLLGHGQLSKPFFPLFPLILVLNEAITADCLNHLILL